jgi:hypothetical protein
MQGLDHTLTSWKVGGEIDVRWKGNSGGGKMGSGDETGLNERWGIIIYNATVARYTQT